MFGSRNSESGGDSGQRFSNTDEWVASVPTKQYCIVSCKNIFQNSDTCTVKIETSKQERACAPDMQNVTTNATSGCENCVGLLKTF